MTFLTKQQRNFISNIFNKSEQLFEIATKALLTKVPAKFKYTNIDMRNYMEGSFHRDSCDTIANAIELYKVRNANGKFKLFVANSEKEAKAAFNNLLGDVQRGELDETSITIYLDNEWYGSVFSKDGDISYVATLVDGQITYRLRTKELKSLIVE